MAARSNSEAIRSSSRWGTATTVRRRAGTVVIALALVLPAIAPTPTVAAPVTYTVTTVQDFDGSCSVTVCSLRQAINSANKNRGPDTIRFSIPGDVVPHTLQPTKELPAIKEAVVIDGTTEPNFDLSTRVPVVQIDGSGAPAAAVGLRISGGGTTVRGLTINAFGTRGSSTTGASGILLERAGGNVIEGNYIGTDASGHANRGNRLAGISIDRSSDNVIGGSTAAARNVISGNGTGLAVSGQSGVATRNRIIGNYIGVDAEGDNKLGNQEGIRISHAAGNTIGGLTASEANVISANAGAGVHIAGTGSQRNVVQGNLIGTDAAGTANFGNFRGLFFVSGALSNTVGGTAAGAGNVIAFNSETGVLVTDTTGGRSVQIRILGNSIHSNGIPGLTGLGIDLTPAGVNPNDTGDVDLGANRKINFPLLQSAVPGSGTTIVGSLNSEAGRTFRLEFFSNSVCDASGYGEGKQYLGSQEVTTSATGAATFTFDSAVPTAQGWFVTATSTEVAFGNTSEFAECRVVTVDDPPSWVVTTAADEVDSSGCTVRHCSLREAMLRANAEPGRDTISFDIPLDPSTASHVISPLTPLPAVAESVVIDGTTEPDYSDTPVVRIDGISSGAGGYGIQLQSGASELRGLSITRWSEAEVSLRSEGNALTGNWLGVTPDGAAAGSVGVGILIESPKNRIGDADPLSGNRIHAHYQAQVAIRGDEADDNRIIGNYIGPQPEDPESGSKAGIVVQAGADGNVLGSPVQNGGNTIATQANYAIRLEDVSNTVVQNNLVTRSSVTVWVDGGSETLVGGRGPLEGNVVTYAQMGVSIGDGSGHVIVGNDLFAAERSIDLGRNAFTNFDYGDGVTPNDALDSDDGPNGLQNFPMLTTAVRRGDVVDVRGMLHGRANTEYQIDLYATYRGHPTDGRCEGSDDDVNNVAYRFGMLDDWIAASPTTVATDGNGNATFQISTPAGAVGTNGNAWIMATATGPEGTSEGGNCEFVTDAATFVQADGTSLSLDGVPWYLHGASIYHASVPGGSGNLTQVLDWAEQAGLNTIRLVNQLDERGIEAGAPYAEAAWVRVDQMLASIGERDLYAILDLSVFRNHLVNKAILDAGLVENCKPNADRTPVSYAALSPYRPDLDDEWDAWMAFVANRVNTVTGVRYRDDPTIAIVSVAGEPGPPNSEECGQAASTQELTDFYARAMSEWQALDPNHLVSNGGFIHLDWEELHGNPFGSGIDWEAIFALEANDVPSIHTYVNYPVPMENPPVPFTEYQTAKIAPFVASLGKPWITEEFGFPQREGEHDDSGRAAYFQQVYDLQANYGSAGAAFWNLGHELGVGTFDVSPSTPAVWETVQLNAP